MLAKLFVWVYNYYCTRQELKRPVTKLKKFKVKKLIAYRKIVKKNKEFGKGERK